MKQTQERFVRTVQICGSCGAVGRCKYGKKNNCPTRQSMVDNVTGDTSNLSSSAHSEETEQALYTYYVGQFCKLAGMGFNLTTLVIVSSLTFTYRATVWTAVQFSSFLTSNTVDRQLPEVTAVKKVGKDKSTEFINPKGPIIKSEVPTSAPEIVKGNKTRDESWN